MQLIGTRRFRRFNFTKTRRLKFHWLIILLVGFGSHAGAKSLGDVVLSAKAGDECDMRKDVLLVEDATSERAYLQCRPAGRGVVGFWQWMPCSRGEKFYFTEQRCLTSPPLHGTGSSKNGAGKISSTNDAASTRVTIGVGLTSVAQSDTQPTSAPMTVPTAAPTTSELVFAGSFVNQSCATGGECLGRSVCDPVSLICVCPPGTAILTRGGLVCEQDTTNNAVPTSTTNHRVRTIAPGGSCKLTTDQCGGGSFCNPDSGVCTCPEGHVDKTGTCTMAKLQAVFPGEKCHQLAYCTGGAACSKGICVCEPPLVQMSNQCAMHTSPVPVKKHSGPGEACDQGQACTGGSLCSTVTLVCTCPIGTRDNGEKCVEVAEMPVNLASVGQNCNSNSDCVAGAFCSASTTPPTCQCLSTHIEVGKSCYRIVFPGQRGCDLNDQCSAGFEGASCKNSVCVCPPGMSARGQTCRPVESTVSPISVGLGQPCTSTSTASFRCSNGSTCVRGYCACPKGRMQLGNNCVAKDARSMNSKVNQTTRTTSTSNPSTSSSSSGTGIMMASPGSSCVAGQHCIGGSICRNGWCVCPDSEMTVVNGTCAFGASRQMPPPFLHLLQSPSTPPQRQPLIPTAGTTFTTQKNAAADFATQAPIPHQPIGRPYPTFGGPNEYPGYYMPPAFPPPFMQGPGQAPLLHNFMIPGAPGVYVPPNPAQGYPPVFIPEPTNSPLFPMDQMRQPAMANGINPNANPYQPYPLLPGLLPAGIRQENGATLNAKPVSKSTMPIYSEKPPRMPEAAPLTATSKNVVLAPPGSSCDDHIQCSGGSLCHRGQCICSEGYEINGERCVPQPTPIVSAAPAESCANGELCDGGSLCDGRVCQCPAGTEPRQGLCQAIPPKLSGPNGPCSNGERCLGESFCNQATGVCECPTSTVAIGVQCVPAGRLLTTNPPTMKNEDSLAQEHETHMQQLQKFQEMTKMVLPQQKLWNPASAYISGVSRAPAPTSNGAVPPVKLVHVAGLSGPEGSCDNGQVCAGGSVCQAGICKCPNNSKANGYGICQATYANSPAAVGETCVEGTVCVGYSTCINGRCRCPPGTMQTGPTCVPLAGVNLPLGSACKSSDVCMHRAICRNGICVCQDGYAEYSGSCQPATSRLFPKPGEACLENETCTGFARCINGRCQCFPGTVIQNETCVAAAFDETASAPGDPCVSIEDCTGGSYCRLGFCVCPLGTESVDFHCVTMNNSGFSSIGQACANGERCTGRSVCVGGVCQCPRDLVNINGVCQPPWQSSNPNWPGQSIIGRSNPYDMTNYGYQPPVQTSPDTQPPSYSLPPTTLNNYAPYTHPAYQQTPDIAGLSRPEIPATYPWATAGISPEARIPLNAILPSLPPNNYSIPVSSLVYQGGNRYSLPLASVLASQSAINDFDLHLILDHLKAYQTGQPIRLALNNIINPSTTQYNPLSYVSPALGPQPIAQQQVQAPTTPIQWHHIFATPPPTAPVQWHQTYPEQTMGYPPIQQTHPLFPSQPSNMAPITVGNYEPQQHQTKNKFSPLPTAAPGQPCQRGQSCFGGAICSMGTCSCPAGLKIGPGNECVADGLYVPPGSFCTTGQTCTGGAYCITGVCLCPPGQDIIGQQCQQPETSHKSAKPNEPCQKGVRCSGGSVCSHDGHCRCLSPSKLIGDRCRQPAQRSRQPNKSNSTRSNSCPSPKNDTLCQLPRCFCSKTGKTAPGDMRFDEIPQFVIFTFDDAINDKNIGPYRFLFDGSRYSNKNECPIRMTFFVSHEGTDYSDVQKLYTDGHEIASNSITHTDLGNERVERWITEIDGQRQILANLGNLNRSDIIGFRAPQLSMGRGAYEMMQKSEFIYDNSMSANPGIDQAPYWPQTMDFSMPWECQNGQCPQRSYPGVWSIPLNQFFNGPSLSSDKETEVKNDDAYVRGAMIRATLSDEETEESFYQLLHRNFMRAYQSNKAPYILTLDGDLPHSVANNGTIAALERFLGEISQKPDVWFVTLSQLLDWMKSPVPLDKLDEFASFSCNRQKTLPLCEKPNRCLYRTKRLSKERHSFKTCSTCPRNFPWIDNVDGN